MTGPPNAPELPTDTPPPGILLDYARDMIVVIDDQGTFRYVNAASKSTLGYDPAELRGENTFDHIHPDDVDRVRRVFEETTARAEEFADASVEYRLRRKDGSYAVVESRFSNLTDSEIGGYVVSSRDVTDRVEAERERDETAARLSQITNYTTDVQWLFTGDWSEVLFVNPAYDEVYGVPAAEMEDDPTGFLDAIHPDDRPRVTEAMERLSAGEPVDMEYRVNPTQNFNRWVWVQGQPIVEDDEVVRIAGFTRDVTDRKRREKQLAVIDTVLRHNLRNDINKILGYVDETASLEGEFDPEQFAECVAVVRNVGEGLLEKAEKQREINRLLTKPPDPTHFDLDRVVEHALRPLWQREGVADGDSKGAVDIEVDVSPDATAYALPELEVAVAELVENAVEHAGDETAVIRVTGRQEGDHAVLEVRDDNPEIPDFDHRVLTGNEEMNAVYHSSGLGLWLVRWVVDLSDGTIEYERDVTAGENVVRIRVQASDGEE